MHLAIKRMQNKRHIWYKLKKGIKRVKSIESIMLVWSIQNVKHFLELTEFIVNHQGYYNRMIFKYSNTRFSIMVSCPSSSSSPNCITELQIMPEFFSFFFSSNRTFQYATISITQIYPTLFLMENNGFSILIFSLLNDIDQLLNLSFFTPFGN